MGVFSQVQNRTERVPSPAKRKITWRGGEHLDEGRFRLSYYDKDKAESVEYKLPMTICPLDETQTITGGGEGYRYWSTEGVYGTEIVLHRTTYHDDGSYTDEEVARGTYAQIKKEVGKQDKNGDYKLPADMKYTTNLYYFNLETEQIEVFEIKGSAVRPFINYKNATKNWKQKKLVIDQDPELKKQGVVYYYAPTYSSAEYGDGEMEKLREPDDVVVDYIKTITGVGQSGGSDGVDQTPAQYQGEENQETGEKGEELDLNDVPFI